MKPRHLAVAAGLALTLSLGAAHAAAPAYAEETPVEHDADAAVQPEGAASGDSNASAAEDEPAEPLPAPSDYDKTDFCEDAAVASVLSARSSSASSLSSVSVSAEMKYFTKYESHSNYRQGFGSGDGYNALGYYQFDRRYALVPFLTAVYSANPAKYAMLKVAVDRGSEMKSADSMYDKAAGTLTELGLTVQNTWYAAYDADPAEFSAFQDAYAYNSYYAPTERWLKSELGIDMSGRADCVKGMVWGLSNLWGTGGVKKVLRGANLRNDMTDREFVTALAAQMTDNIVQYSSQTQYYKGWGNRYRNELNDCLAYISLHETNAGGSDAPAGDAGTDEGNAGSAGDAGVSEVPADDAESDDAASDGLGDPDNAAKPEGEAGVDDADKNDASENGGAVNDDALGSGADDALAESTPSGDAGEADDEKDNAPDGAVRPDVTPSQSTPAPSAPSGSVAVEGSDATPGDDGSTEGGNTSVESVEVDERVDGDTQDDDDTLTKSPAEREDERVEATQVTSTEKSARSGGDGSTEVKSDPAQQSEGDSSEGDRQEDGNADQSNKPSGNLPQTADLALLAGLTAASAATFGATFVYAGKAGLIKRKDRKSE